MKTRIGVFTVLLFLLSAIAAAQQGLGNDLIRGNNLSGANDLDLDFDFDNLTDEISAQAVESPECTGFLKGKFPGVNDDRLESMCQRLQADTDRLKAMVQNRVGAMRNLSEEKKAALGELNQERRAFMERFREEDLGKLNELAKEQFKNAAMLGRTQLKECLQGNETHARECVAGYQIRKFQDKAEMFRQRVVRDTESLRNRFQELKERYEDIKDELKEERASWQEAVESGTEEEQVETGKEYFGRTADLIINNLEKIRSKVEENDDLTEEEAAEIIADIDAKIAEIEAAKEDIDSAQTKEELKESASEIVQRWKSMQHKVQLHLEYLGRAKVMDVMKRSEYLERKVENAVAKLQEEGYDTAELDSLVTEFSDKINSAREDFQEGNEFLIQAKNMARANETKEQVQATMQKGKDLIKGAHDKLVEAHQTSKAILAKIREMTGNIDSVTEESEEDYVAVEEAEDQEDDDDEDSEAEDDDSEDSDDEEEE